MFKRTDNNQRKLVQQIRKLGASVTHLHSLGHGVPDLLIGIKGRNYLFEIKDPDKSPSKRKLTPGELEFLLTWKGQVSVVETIDDVIKIIG